MRKLSAACSALLLSLLLGLQAFADAAPITIVDRVEANLLWVLLAVAAAVIGLAILIKALKKRRK